MGIDIQWRTTPHQTANIAAIRYRRLPQMNIRHYRVQVTCARPRSGRLAVIGRGGYIFSTH